MTDHKSLKELMSQHVQTPEQQVYLAKLLGYDYKIMYKAGSHNLVADALSRAHEIPAEGFWLLTGPQFKFLEDLKKELSTNQEFITLRDKVMLNPQDVPDYSFIDGLLLFKGRIWLNKGSTHIPLLLAEFHKSPLGGHMGTTKTLSRLKENFYWASMRQDVLQFIQTCSDCQHTKYMTQKPVGLLQPLCVPHRP